MQVYTVPFLWNDKPVFNVEYRKDYGVCLESISLGIDTIFKVGQQASLKYSPTSSRKMKMCVGIYHFPGIALPLTSTLTVTLTLTRANFFGQPSKTR